MSLLVPMKRNNSFIMPAFGELENQLERIFRTGAGPTCGTQVAWTPAVDIHETDEAYILEADLPGLTQKDIEVNVVEDRVTIRGTRNHEEDENKTGCWRRERAAGTFERSFGLQGGIDGSKVDARFENGVLTVKLPKPEDTKPRQIEVKIN